MQADTNEINVSYIMRCNCRMLLNWRASMKIRKYQLDTKDGV